MTNTTDNRVYEQVFGKTWDETRSWAFSCDQGYWDFHMTWWMVRDAIARDTRFAAEDAIWEALHGQV